MIGALVRRALLVAFALCSLPSTRAEAHTATMSVLVLQERSPGVFISSWEQTQTIKDPSAAYDLLRPVFPEQCRFTPPRLDCGTEGLNGTIGFDGLGDLSTSGLIKISWLRGETQLLSLSAAAPHVRVASAEKAGVSLGSIPSFIGIGVTHIWLGWDHLLFVLGLLWFLPAWRPLLKTITAFTIAHSITLAAASLEILSLPSAAVEAVIALSIAFVAVEMVRELRTGRDSLTRRYPWLVAFSFGLLHGFGFANALSELQLGRSELPLALACFNVGVELGQLAFVGALLGLRPLWRRLESALGARAVTLYQYAMGSIAMYWFVERIVALLPAA